MRHIRHVRAIRRTRLHERLPVGAGNGIDGVIVLMLPLITIAQIPHAARLIRRGSGAVIWPEEDKCANGILSRRGEVFEGAILTQPWREGDELVVGFGQVGLAGDVGGDEGGADGDARVVRREIGDVEQAGDGLGGGGVGGGQGGDVAGGDEGGEGEGGVEALVLVVGLVPLRVGEDDRHHLERCGCCEGCQCQ